MKYDEKYFLAVQHEDGTFEEFCLEINEVHLLQRINERVLGKMTLDILFNSLDAAFQRDEVFDTVFYDMKQGQGFIIQLAEFNCTVMCSVKDMQTVRVHSILNGMKRCKFQEGYKCIRVKEYATKLLQYVGGEYIEWNPLAC